MREAEEEGSETRGSGQWDPGSFASAGTRGTWGTEGGPCAPLHLPAPISPPPSGSNAPVRLGRVGTRYFRGFLRLSGQATLHGGCESVWLSLPVPTSLSLPVPHLLAVSPALLSATLCQGDAKPSSLTQGGDNPWPNLPFSFFFLVGKPLILN